MRQDPARGALNARQRTRDLDRLQEHPYVDVLVVGGGVTGAGVALDAVTRGLSVLLVEEHDLAWGTSRFSSKLVHGGLRYLKGGHFPIAAESAAERGILMEHTAPHLARPLPTILPLYPATGRRTEVVTRTGLAVADGLRIGARTRGSLLPRARRVASAEVLHRAPALRRDGLRGGFCYWDGQLEDDARLVVTLARTAAAYGATVLTRCTARHIDGRSAVLYDGIGGGAFSVTAGAVVNATGVWASRLVDGITLHPSRGSHLVLPAERLRNLRTSFAVPVPGGHNQYVFVLPEPSGRVYVGITDVPAESPAALSEPPQPSEEEVTFLLDVLNDVLADPVSRSDVIGSFAGLRPLIETGRHSTGAETADLSRRHVVHTSRDGVVTVVGGKLTTYRRMAEDAVDVAVSLRGLDAGRCRTRRLPLLGAATRVKLGHVHASARLVARYGTEALAVIAEAGGDAELLQPVAPGVDTIPAELLFAIRHEAALDAADLLDRRTRIGLVPSEAAAAKGAVQQALDRCADLLHQ